MRMCCDLCPYKGEDALGVPFCALKKCPFKVEEEPLNLTLEEALETIVAKVCTPIMKRRDKELYDAAMIVKKNIESLKVSVK